MRKILRGHVFNIAYLFTLCLGFAFSATHAQVSGTFTINSAVATGGSNFQTFSAAAAFLSGGVNGQVTFNVQPGSGPYNEQVVLSNITGTSATNTITFNCNGVRLLFLSTNTNSRAGFKLNNTDYVTINNLQVEPQAANMDEFGYGFHLLNDADNNTIKNCHVINNLNWDFPERTEGIVINGNDGDPQAPGTSNCDNNLIQNNIIEGSGTGITLFSKPAGSNPIVLMNGNKLINNTITNWWLNGIELLYTSNTQVDKNDLPGGPLMYNPVGIALDSINQMAVVTNNRIHDIAIDVFSFFGAVLNGIRINCRSIAGQENLIANNAIYNWISDGNQYGIISDGGTFFNVYHNSISFDDQTQKGDDTRGVSLQDVTDVNFMNNVVSVSRKVGHENYCLYINNDPPRFASDHNVFYAGPQISPGKAYVGLYKGNFGTTLPVFRSLSGKDIFSKEVNPSFVNVAAGNLTPTVQAVDNLGLYVSVNADINNAARSTINPDPGAYEFTSAACATSITPGTMIITPDSVLCQGPKVSMGLNGNTAGNGQTYTWQSSTTQFGTYTNVSGALNYPYFEVTPVAPLYYRVAVTCGATTQFSSPMKVLVTTALNGGTYTINNALPTGGVNFNSFSDAIRAMQCGLNGSVVFNVASGGAPYQEQVVIPALGTSPNKTITFNGNGATVGFNTTNTKTTVIKLDGADYITIDSLNVAIQGTSGYGLGILLMNDADNNTIKRCTVNLDKTSLSANYAGIVIGASDNTPVNEVTQSYCENNLFANNTIIGGYYGINVCSQTDLTVPVLTANGNTVRNNTLKDNCGYGIYIAGTANTTVDSNDISATTRSVFGPNPYEAIHVNKISLGLKITKNRIHDLFLNAQTSVIQISGIVFKDVPGTAAQPNIVSNNLMYNYKGLGIQEGLYTLSSDYVKFYHNTVNLDDTSATNALETRGIGVFASGGNSTGVEFKDNIIVIRRGGIREKYGIFVNKPDSNVVADYNNYYMRSPKGRDSIGSMGGIIYRTLTDWLATRKDAHTINIDPVFNDIAKGDLTPTKILFENKGSSVGITTDLFNNTRNTTTPDIGAIEFTICSPLTNPVVTVEDAQPNIVKFAWNSISNTTGYRVSRDNLNWTIPSSGAMGLSHTVTGLKSTDSVTLWVKALGTRADCPDYTSLRGARALTDGVFVPNTFTPNNDGHNDKFKVYSAVVKSVHWMVFSQWGEKVFESNDINGEWDGTYKGKALPVGVYVYVVSGTIVDGTKVTKKGSFNLVR